MRIVAFDTEPYLIGLGKRGPEGGLRVVRGACGRQALRELLAQAPEILAILEAAFRVLR
jgi:hypothetical protein